MGGKAEPEVTGPTWNRGQGPNLCVHGQSRIPSMNAVAESTSCGLYAASAQVAPYTKHENCTAMLLSRFPAAAFLPEVIVAGCGKSMSATWPRKASLGKMGGLRNAARSQFGQGTPPCDAIRGTRGNRNAQKWLMFTSLRNIRSFYVHQVTQAATATFTYVSRWSDPTDWPFNEPPISTDQTWIPPGRLGIRTAKFVASVIGYGFWVPASVEASICINGLDVKDNEGI